MAARTDMYTHTRSRRTGPRRPGFRPAGLALAALALSGLPLLGCAGESVSMQELATGDASGSLDTALGQCVGVKPPASAWQATPGPVGQPPIAAPVLGSPAPVFALEDVQPLSCGYGAKYGLQAVAGKVAVVALWAGW